MRSYVVLLCLSIAMFWGKLAYAYDGPPSEVETLIEYTLQNMVFVEGGAFMMGDSEEEMIAAFGDKSWFRCSDRLTAEIRWKAMSVMPPV